MLRQVTDHLIPVAFVLLVHGGWLTLSCVVRVVWVVRDLWGMCSHRQFVTVFLLGALTALSVWLYIDLIIVAEEASKIRPFTERAAHVAAVRRPLCFTRVVPCFQQTNHVVASRGLFGRVGAVGSPPQGSRGGDGS